MGARVAVRRVRPPSLNNGTGWIHSVCFQFLNSNSWTLKNLNSNSLTLKKLNLNSLILQKSNSNSSIIYERIQIQFNPIMAIAMPLNFSSLGKVVVAVVVPSEKTQF